MSLKNKLKSLDDFLDNSKVGKFINNSEWIRGKKGFYIGSAAVIATSVADIFITQTILNQGGQEVQPFANYMLDRVGMAGLVGQKAIISQWVIGASYLSRINLGLPVLSAANIVGTVAPAIYKTIDIISGVYLNNII